MSWSDSVFNEEDEYINFNSKKMKNTVQIKKQQREAKRDKKRKLLKQETFKRRTEINRIKKETRQKLKSYNKKDQNDVQ
jgi:hypothetical protein